MSETSQTHLILQLIDSSFSLLYIMSNPKGRVEYSLVLVHERWHVVDSSLATLQIWLVKEVYHRSALK